MKPVVVGARQALPRAHCAQNSIATQQQSKSMGAGFYQPRRPRFGRGDLLMTRLPLALALLGIASMATIASAQSYPQTDANYGPNAMQAMYYGQAQSGPGYPAQAGMYPAQGGGMYPAQGGMPNGMYPAQGGMYPPQGGMYASLPNGPMYGGGYPGGYAGTGYPPGMMPQQMPNQPDQSQIQQQQMQASAPQKSNASQPVPGAEYHGPQGAIAKANPPPMKLPKGVTAENGLLYYNGSPTAPSPDVAYQQFPMNQSSGGMNRLAAYQADGQSGTNSGATSSVMNPSANYGNGMPAGNAANYGNSASQGCEQGNCNQGNCDDGCPYCGWLTAPYHCFFNICHGSIFPGKLGYVWQAGYDSLAMTRNAGADRTLLRVDNGGTPLPVAFNSNEFNFDWDYGGKAHVELIGPSGITYQFAYTRIATFVANDTLFSGQFGGNGLSLPGAIVNFSGFADGDQAQFYYSSAIQTGEFNMIFPFGSFEVLAGYRYMSIGEVSEITLFPAPAATFVADSLNTMNGGQIGALGRWQLFGMFDFDFDAKFAVMGDAARTEQNAVDATGTPVTLSPVEGTKTRVAFVSELGLQAVLPLGASLSAHAGYNVYFIDRVALAPDQFAFGLGTNPDAGTNVNNHGDIVLQGVNVGLTAVW